MAHERLESGWRPQGAPLGAEPGTAGGAPSPGWAVAHDLAGGVRGIVQLCGLIETQADRLPPDAARRLAALGKRARRLQRFLRDLQELERRPGARAQACTADPAAVVREVVAGLEPELAALRPRLHLGPLPPLAVAPVDLARLLGNLIANALQHRSPVKPRIEIAARPSGALVELTVTDNGPGVPPALRAALFEPFTRLPSARQPPGSGLGLAVCRTIVESYGGRIWVEAAPGGGSRFGFTLPAAEP